MTTGRITATVRSHDAIVRIAEAHGVTSAQVVPRRDLPTGPDPDTFNRTRSDEGNASCRSICPAAPRW